MKDYDTSEIDRLEAAGFFSEAIAINHKKKTVKGPYGSLEDLLDDGWAPAGTKMVFLNKNGHTRDRGDFMEIEGEHTEFTVRKTHISGYHSEYEFEEVAGKCSTCMFERVIPHVPSIERRMADLERSIECGEKNVEDTAQKLYDLRKNLENDNAAYDKLILERNTSTS